MKSLKQELESRFESNINFKEYLPELGCDDLEIIEAKDFDGDITLWLCNDEAGNRYIIRDDNAGLTGICLFDSREDQLTFSAWNVDFDITTLADWINEDDMVLAIEDAKANHWGF